MSGILYAIDPGTEQSALVMLGPDRCVTGKVHDNWELLRILREWPMNDDAMLVIEEVASYGMPVGREVFETVFWAGRFAEAWSRRSPYSYYRLMPRKDVKLTLCGSPRAKDANIRQALIDRYGGPACVKKGGPLAGIKSHLWAALALAVTYQETGGALQKMARERAERK